MVSHAKSPQMDLLEEAASRDPALGQAFRKPLLRRGPSKSSGHAPACYRICSYSYPLSNLKKSLKARRHLNKSSSLMHLKDGDWSSSGGIG